MGRRQKRRAAKASERERRVTPADLSQQAPNNSYSPPEFCEDITFTCRDCGDEEVWTAEQQRWYYEVAKGSIYATAVRCRDCRRKIAAQKELQRQQMAAAEERRNSGQP